MANPFDQFDNAEPATGGNPFDRFDSGIKPELPKMGKEAFAEALKAEIAADPIKGAIGAFGAGTSDLIERGKQFFGKEDRNRIEANKIMTQASPVSAFAGDMLSPASIAMMKLMPVFKGATTIGSKIAQYAGNVAAPAAAGGVMAALKPDADMESVQQGAAGGAIAGGVVAPLMSLGAKGAGWLYDTLRGARPDLNAAKIMRDAAGNQINAIRSQGANAADDITAAQAAYGIDRDTWQALGEMAKRNDKDSFYRVLADRQAAQQEAIKQGVAGGANQTAAIATRIGDKKALNAEFVPRMNMELNAANEGQKLAQYQGQANALGEAAANKVQDVRRMTAVADRAENMGTEFGRRAPATALEQPTGMPSAGKAYSYGQELANRAESEAAKAAGDSLILGEGRRFSQGIADSLAAHGVKPLDVNPIISGLQSKLANPTAAGNKKYGAVLERVGNDIQEWAARNGGVIDARALYAIRKNSVNDAVETLTAGLDPKASAKYAAQVLADVRPMIDEAIVGAGGTAWPTTLKIFEKGMIPINRKEMGAELLRQSKEKFAETVAGNNPKAVRKVFGPGAYDINAEMGGQMRGLNKVAGEYTRDAEIARQASAGEGGLARILDADTMKFRFPAWISRETTVANKALETLETRLDKATMDRLVEGMKSGKSANRLLELMPTSQQKNLLSQIIETGGYRPAVVAGSAAVQ